MVSPVDLRTMELIEGEAELLPSRLENGTPAERLAAWQLAQVRNLIPYLRANSSHYAGSLADVDENRVGSGAVFAELPFTLPEEVRGSPESFLCTAARDVRRIATVPSSGSTGEPKRFSFTDNDLERTLDFFAHGMRSLAGEGKRVAILLSAPTPDSIASLLGEALGRIGAIAGVNGHPVNMESAAAAARGADCLVGLPTEILHLCRAHPELRPESVLLTADYIPRSAVRDIERIWGCRTYSHYGMTETGYGLAVQCFRGGSHHLRHADVLVEIVDPQNGTPVPPGGEGEVVVTTFRHRAMPLLRYRTGDIASIDASPCPCGGLLPRLGRIKGRIGRPVDLGCGRTTTQEELDEIVYAFESVRDYRAKLMRNGEDRVLSLTVEADECMDCEFFEQELRELIPCRLAFSYESLPPADGVRKRRIE